MSVVRRLTWAVTITLIALVAHAQSIVTVAGGGTLDGQLVSNVPINGPENIKFDHAGNIYVASRYDGQVLEIDAVTRVVKVIAGNGAAGFTGDGGLASRATLRQPSGLALDADDNLFIADTLNNRIRRVDAKTGIITTFAGGGTPDSGIGDGGAATAAILGTPVGLTIDRGFLYITEQAYDSNRVRRVNLSTGVIDTIAGKTDGSRGAFSGDGGPAINADLDSPNDIAADADGNLYIADTGNIRVRRIDTNGIITTYAGGGAQGTFDDGIPATSADLNVVTEIAFDRGGNLLVAAYPNIRRVDKTTHAITTVVPGAGLLYGMAVASDGTIFCADGSLLTVAPGATEPVVFGGNGTFVGDGLAARAAVLHSPEGVALDKSGNLFIADSAANIVRRVSASDGTISTVAGSVGSAYANGVQDGLDATEAAVGYPQDVAFDASGNLYIADPLNDIVWRVDAAGKITAYAGGGSPDDSFGDNGPATQARVVPWGLAFDAAGNLYIADDDAFATPPHARVRRVDAVTKTITTIAGTSAVGYAGDGGPATAAQLNAPFGVAVDIAGNVYVSENGNGTIRKIDRAGVITTFAGNPSLNEGDPLGDEGPATSARMTPLHMAINPTTGDLVFADHGSHRVRRVDTQGIVHTIAGSDQHYYEGGFSGDNGPATDAKLSFDYGDASGIAISPSGDIEFSDSQNNRVRAVFACVSVSAPQLTAPAGGAANTPTSPALTWSSVRGAFRYDLRVDTVSPPVRVIASDLTQTTFTPSLAPGTQYFWSVTAKGDSFCPAVSTAASAIASFTTVAGCGAGAFDLIAPADGATSAAQLSWQASSGASTYDLYLGTNNPPPLFESGLTSTTHAVPNVPGKVFWFVVAHAACDATKTAATPVRSYTASGAPLCGAAATVTVVSPPDHATNVATSVDLTWSISQVSAPLDIYFGTTPDPPLLRSGLTATTTSLTLPPLDAGVTYYWRIVAGCSAPLSTPVASFTTQSACNTPQSVQILFAPASVSAGATYTIVWSAAAGLDLDGGYLVERSTSPSFASILDSQVTSSTAASFVAGATGTVYHRIRAIPSCDPTKSGPVSDVQSVSITNAPSNIIFTVQPSAIVTSLGEAIEDRKGSFTLENIGPAPAQIIVGQSELPGSRPFFSIAEGGAFITLQPRVPKTFTIQYSGPPNDVAGSYQGVIFATAVGGTSQLAVTPYAFVNLKVGGTPAVAPQFIIDGTPADYVAFPGFSGADDSARPGREVAIRNPGSTPMDLAAEVGPDVWLVPEDGWNSQPLAPGATRTFKLFTRRPFAPSGSPLPRYTYFTVRTKDGASSRLLVQDNDQLSIGSGRTSALDVSVRSFIVPDVANRLRLTNNGGDSVQVELIFTPTTADGFDPAVKRAVILVPPNDVVTLVDPIGQLFGAPGLFGDIEARVPPARMGLISVSASVPVVTRGAGARVASPQVIDLPPVSGGTASLTLTETSGVDHASVTAASDNGQTIVQDIARYGMKHITVLPASRWDITVNSGGGSVAGLASLGGMTVLSRPATDRTSASSIVRAFWKTAPAATIPSVTTVVPVISGTSSAGSAPAYKTAIGLVAQSSAAQFLATFYPSAGGAALVRTISLNAGQTTVYNDVMKDLFGASSPSDGNLFFQGPPNGKVYAVLEQTTSGGATVPASSLPLPTTLSEALTSATSASQRPLSLDGLEQSVDPTRGTRWVLLLNEVGGAAGFVNVKLYEAGNRSSAIADKDMQISSNQQLKLDTVFAALGLDEADRRKDRTNVEVVVTATAGSARIAASAVSIDNQSGDTKVYALTPVVGSGNPNINFATPVVSDQPPPSSRHRGVRH